MPHQFDHISVSEYRGRGVTLPFGTSRHAGRFAIVWVLGALSTSRLFQGFRSWVSLINAARSVRCIRVAALSFPIHGMSAAPATCKGLGFQGFGNDEFGATPIRCVILTVT